MWECFKGAWGLIQGRFRADIPKKALCGSRLQKVGTWASEDLRLISSFKVFGVGKLSCSNFLASTASNLLFPILNTAKLRIFNMVAKITALLFGSAGCSLLREVVAQLLYPQGLNGH